MIRRILVDKLVFLAKKFPVVSITGPRQSGKTTLVRMVFKNYDYVSLENPEERDFALNDPKGFLRRFAKYVILDEIQKTPHLFSYIQGMVDEADTPGRFILTGSQQFHLMYKVSQTLAGRSAIVNLLPFSLSELCRRKPIAPHSFDSLSGTKKPPLFNLETLLYQGFYPRIYDKGLDAHDWLSTYYRTYVERDVRTREPADVLNHPLRGGRYSRASWYPSYIRHSLISANCPRCITGGTGQVTR